MPHSVADSTVDFDSASDGSNPSGVANLYLIAHKVRGALAFDIAEQMNQDGEVWWILPSTGHRAYPFWDYPLCELGYFLSSDDFVFVTDRAKPMPKDLQDFWSITVAPSAIERKAERNSGLNLLQSIGITVERKHHALSGELKRRI